uniref:Uncharacterized protein n=1 Tax=Siphoviridae sp. ctuy39 TaxID=2825719 RepID=A0A8S5VE69_9CAUD|nr:MAG TPA: hypothetical protein [Siphoviridae sp. ctuy39]
MPFSTIFALSLFTFTTTSSPFFVAFRATNCILQCLVSKVNTIFAFYAIFLFFRIKVVAYLRILYYNTCIRW